MYFGFKVADRFMGAGPTGRCPEVDSSCRDGCGLETPKISGPCSRDYAGTMAPQVQLSTGPSKIPRRLWKIYGYPAGNISRDLVARWSHGRLPRRLLQLFPTKWRTSAELRGKPWKGNLEDHQVIHGSMLHHSWPLLVWNFTNNWWDMISKWWILIWLTSSPEWYVLQLIGSNIFLAGVSQCALTFFGLFKYFHWDSTFCKEKTAL